MVKREKFWRYYNWGSTKIILKKPLNKYFRRWIYITLTFGFIAIVFKLYELDTYTWFCEEEKNTGSCLLAARLYKKASNFRQAEKYLSLSCVGGYELACKELEELGR